MAVPFDHRLRRAWRELVGRSFPRGAEAMAPRFMVEPRDVPPTVVARVLDSNEEEL
jgi:hypothetical protein